MSQKCKIGRCPEDALTRNILCKTHWMIVPWEWRRHVSKLLRKNDMFPDKAYDECMQRAYGFVIKTLKEKDKPPHPAGRKPDLGPLFDGGLGES